MSEQMSSEHIVVRRSNEELHAEFKALRVSIDACIKEAQSKVLSMYCRKGSDELDIAIIKLKEAKMWCGKVLEELDHRFPQEFRDEAKR